MEDHAVDDLSRSCRAQGETDHVLMPKPLVIRAAQPADYEPLGDLLVYAYDTIPGATLDPDYNIELRAVASRAAVSTVLVAAIDDRVVGGITYVDGGPLVELSNPGDSEIRMFAVAEDARGAGAGRALLAACIAKATDAGRHRVWLSTSPWMNSAQRLYRRHHFRRVPDRDRVEPSSGEAFELLAYVLDL